MRTRDSADLRKPVRLLALQFTGLITVLFLLLGMLLYALVSRSATEALDRTLQDSARVDSPRDLRTGAWITIVDTDGDPTVSSHDLPHGLPDSAAIDSVLATGAAVWSDVSTDGNHYRVLTTSDHGHVVQAAVDVRESREELSRLLWALIGAGAGALLVSAFAATWMARRAIRPLADALTLQRRFVADASHELRTPLTLLSTRAQLLRRRVPSADGQSALGVGLDEIVQDSRELTATLEDLLISADPRAITAFERVDLTVLGRDAVNAYREDAGARGIDLEALVPPSPVETDGAPTSLQRLFAALVGNALDHARSRVTITIAIEGRYAVATVADDGPGFSPEFEERAFERFASSRSSEGNEGGQRHYGLGLALVADIATRHGGDVAVLPRRDAGGAAVRVRLPMSPHPK